MRVVLTGFFALLLFGGQTPDIHFVPTTRGIVDAMLTLAHVTPDDVVYDLGSGEGDIVIRAAQKFGARGVGVEIDAKLVKKAEERARKQGVADRVTFRQGDLFKADISDATVIAIYLTPSINLRLAPKLKAELKPGSRIVSHRFGIDDWQPDEERSAGGRKIFLFTIR